jgi:ubiquinone/menaquinone biosynthesis C-methylase UbiE
LEKKHDSSYENGVAVRYSKQMNTGFEPRKYITLPSFLKAIGDLKDENILDLGCGNGYVTSIFCTLTEGNIIAVDKSEEMLGQASETLKHQISINKAIVVKADCFKSFSGQTCSALLKKSGLVTAMCLIDHAENQ